MLFFWDVECDWVFSCTEEAVGAPLLLFILKWAIQISLDLIPRLSPLHLVSVAAASFISYAMAKEPPEGHAIC